MAVQQMTLEERKAKTVEILKHMLEMVENEGAKVYNFELQENYETQEIGVDNGWREFEYTGMIDCTLRISVHDGNNGRT